MTALTFHVVGRWRFSKAALTRVVIDDPVIAQNLSSTQNRDTIIGDFIEVDAIAIVVTLNLLKALDIVCLQHPRRQMKYLIDQFVTPCTLATATGAFVYNP